MNAHMIPMLSQEAGLQRYFDEIKKFPILSEQDEYSLAVRWYEEGDLISAQKLVTAHLRLVAKIAMQFKGYGIPLMDMISEGNIGLMTAVKKFNPYRGYRLSTYAMWWIKANIQDFVLRSWSMVKIGTSSLRKKLFFNLRKVQNKLMQLNNSVSQANDSEVLAKELAVSVADIDDMNNRMLDASGMSLNEELYEGNDAEVIELVAEPSADPESRVLEDNEYAHKKQKLREAMSMLSAREQEIIAERHLKETPTKLIALGRKLALSSERVRQIEARAMQKLIAHIQSNQ